MGRAQRRAIGLLLLVPVAGWFGQVVLLVSKIATGDTLATAQLVLAGVIAAAIIAAGYLFRTGPARPCGASA